MLFFNDEFIDILQKYYRWTNDQLKQMAGNYFSTMIELIIDNSLAYMENNNLPEMQEFNELIKKNSESKRDITTQIPLIEFALNLHKNHPDLEKSLMDRIKAIDQDLTTGLLQGIDEQTAIKIMQIIEKDTVTMDKYIEKLKGWGITGNNNQPVNQPINYPDPNQPVAQS